MDIYIGSYGPKYGDACGTFVGTTPGNVSEALEYAVAYETEQLAECCEHSKRGCPEDCPECIEWGTCSMCHPEMVTWGVSYEPHPVRHGFMNLRQAKEVVRDLKYRQEQGWTLVTAIEEY